MYVSSGSFPFLISTNPLLNLAYGAHTCSICCVSSKNRSIIMSLDAVARLKSCQQREILNAFLNHCKIFQLLPCNTVLNWMILTLSSVSYHHLCIMCFFVQLSRKRLSSFLLGIHTERFWAISLARQWMMTLRLAKRWRPAAKFGMMRRRKSEWRKELISRADFLLHKCFQKHKPCIYRVLLDFSKGLMCGGRGVQAIGHLLIYL